MRDATHTHARTHSRIEHGYFNSGAAATSPPPSASPSFHTPSDPLSLDLHYLPFPSLLTHYRLFSSPLLSPHGHPSSPSLLTPLFSAPLLPHPLCPLLPSLTPSPCPRFPSLLTPLSASPLLSLPLVPLASPSSPAATAIYMGQPDTRHDWAKKYILRKFLWVAAVKHLIKC